MWWGVGGGDFEKGDGVRLEGLEACFEFSCFGAVSIIVFFFLFLYDSKLGLCVNKDSIRSHRRAVVF